ncbi:MAG: hypothetical protein K2L78_02010, partial [Muribaculaceae bacterium]|nr:hypothetical protein [Muribaculaceae bacterium]
MKKIIATLCAAFISAVCVTGLKAQETAAPEEVTVLQVNLKSGAVDKFRLPDKPTVTFEGDNMVVESEGMQGNYARADVSHFNFGIDKLSAVDTTAMQA